MLLIHAFQPHFISKANACRRLLAMLLLTAGLWLVSPVAQAQGSQDQASPTPTPKSNAPAEAGGPQGDIGPIAVPKKKDEPPSSGPEPPCKTCGEPRLNR